jgi:glycerol-3-phosphate cytidylyltransferase
MVMLQNKLLKGLLRMFNIIVIGGSNGLGFAISSYLADNKEINSIHIFDKEQPISNNKKFIFHKVNLANNSFLEEISRVSNEINAVFITAGLGRLDYANNFSDFEIDLNFKVNVFPTLKTFNIFKNKIFSKSNFYFCTITSISSMISSPLYSIYSSSKSAVSRFVESVNAELEYMGFFNRITNIAPGSFKGSSFNGDVTQVNLLLNLAKEIVNSTFNKIRLYIPNFEDVYSKVLNDYNNDPRSYGQNSIKFKLQNNKIESIRKYKVGYLSGTFDLFHVGHLNLIQNAKQVCDYLIVGVHLDGKHKNAEVFIPFEERVAILKSISYVDQVVQSELEDSDAYYKYNYDILFVGSDYKGTSRFENYEKILTKFGVKIIYFPYTTTTSSTKIKKLIELKSKS